MSQYKNKNYKLKYHTDWVIVAVLAIVSIAMNILSRDLCAPIIITIAIFVTLKYRIHSRFFQDIWPLALLLFIGIPGIFNNEIRNIIRDILFALTPIALILIGYWLSGRASCWKTLPVAIVWLGVIFAFQNISVLIADPSLIFSESMIIREKAGNVADITVLGFAVLIFNKKFNFNRSLLQGIPYWCIFSILLASIFLSFSRTAVVVIILISLASIGWLSRRKMKLIFLFIAVIMLLIFSNGDYSVVEGERLTFTSKIIRSFQEIAISNYDSMTDISLNWRGFETFKTLEQYYSGTTSQIVFGQGFGALTDLGFYMALGGDASVDFRFIPVMHNGYAYILLKYGFLGICLYFIFYAKMVVISLRYQNIKSQNILFSARLLFGLVISLAFVMFVGGGMAELFNSEYVILMGALLKRLRSDLHMQY